MQKKDILKAQDKFEIFRAELDRKDQEIHLVENLRKCGADKNKKDLKQTEGYYIDSIKAKLALLKDVA